MNKTNWTSVLVLPLLALSLAESGCAMDAEEGSTSEGYPITSDSTEGKAAPNEMVGVDTRPEGTTQSAVATWEFLGTVRCVPGCRVPSCACTDPPCLVTPVVNAPCTPAGRICQVRSGQEASRYFCH